MTDSGWTPGLEIVFIHCVVDLSSGLGGKVLYVRCVFVRDTELGGESNVDLEVWQYIYSNA
jgi:hypothetical protein